MEEIDAMSTWQGSELNKAKEILAYELTKLVHGDEEAEKAQSAAKAVFGSGDSANMPSVTLNDSDFTDGSIDILSMLVCSGLVPSKSEARRAVEQGGVTVDGEKITDIKKRYDSCEFDEGKVLKRGKKNFIKLVK
jgi:tyrosyl-tRNA synthetase